MESSVMLNKPRETLDISMAIFKVVELLKKHRKKGLTQTQLENELHFDFNKKFTKDLKKSPKIEFSNGRYSYKFLHDINDIDQLREALNPNANPIVLDEEVLNSYDNMEEDIKEERAVLTVLHATTKKTILYPVLFPIPPDIVNFRLGDRLSDGAPTESMDVEGEDKKEPEAQSREAVRALWAKVKIGDYTQLRNCVRDHGHKLSQLDINVLPEEFRRTIAQKKGQRAPRKTAKREKTQNERQLSEIAQAARHLFTDLNVNATLKLDADEDEDEEDEKKKFLFQHNIEANRDEFELLSELMNMVGVWFFDDIHLLVLHYFLKQKVYRESDIAKQLSLTQKQIASAMQILHNHHFLNKVLCESAAGHGQGARSFTIWQMDLDKLVNSVWYHIIKEGVKAELDKIGEEILECLDCEVRYKIFDVVKLKNEIDSKYYCKHCQKDLIRIDNDEEKASKQSLYAKLEKQLAPIEEKLKALESVGREANKAGKFVTNLRKPTPRASLAQASHQTKTNAAKPEPMGDKKLRKNSNIQDIVVDNNCKFVTTPLAFSGNDLVFLRIVKLQEHLMRETGFRLAKDVLNDVGEFSYIIDGAVYVYRITEQSLYLAYMCGYTASAIVRLLTTLSMNAMPMALAQLIYNYTNDKKYYRATVTLKHSKINDGTQIGGTKLRHCIQSTEKEVLLISDPVMKDRLSRQSNQLEEVEGELRTYNFGIIPGENENLKKAAFNLGYPIIDRYNFLSTNDFPISCSLRDTAHVRDYQRAAINKVLWRNEAGQLAAHSGVLVLPCGGGKTLIGVGVIATIKKPTIIFCQSNLALAQWKEQILKWTHMGTHQVCRFSSEYDKEWDSRAPVIITTYHMFSSRENNRRVQSKEMMALCKAREWGLTILGMADWIASRDEDSMVDEVHLAPAKIFRRVTNAINCHIKIGLTATMVREDELVEEIPHLVGPTLFNLDIFTLRAFNHIAPVKCTEINIPLSDYFADKFRHEEDREVKTMMWTCNPNKLRVVYELMVKHVRKNNKVMVFCDNLFALDVYQQILKCPKVEGSTPTAERVAIIKKFKEEGGNCVLFSTVGDQSIDLPEADVVIQLALTDGSRMQEGQRIGRVQRAYKGKTTAYFYSLISSDTDEYHYAEKRRNFLHQNGYTVEQIASDDWEKTYADSKKNEEKFSFLTEEWEENLIGAIHNELKSRGEKKANKLAGIVVEPETPKRLRQESTTEEIRKIVKRTKHG